MLLCGVGLGWLSGFLGDVEGTIIWRGGAVASLLGVCVVLYDAVLKATAAGPVAMGACRFLNVLLGMSLAVPVTDGWNVAGYGAHHLIAASGIGIYVVGVTVFARTEARASSAWRLWLGTALMMGGIAVLGLLHRNLSAPNVQTQPVWIILLGLLAFSILRRCGTAALDPTPRQVQLAVKHAVMSIIVLDAAVVLEVASWYYALGVLALLIPALVVGQWISST
jgi:4-hydroxybenzoate polyprenyltransferase